MMDVLKVAPEGFVTWMMERSKRPAMVRLLENRTYTRKVAAKLIDDKRQELKDGTSRRDVLSLLGSSCAAVVKLCRWCNVCFVSQGEFRSATGLAVEGR